MADERDVVTGAFGFTGRAIARQLLEAGRSVTTLTRRRPEADDPLSGRLSSVALDFSRPDVLVDALRGADTLYDTYWIRFPRGTSSFERTIAESTILISAAREAGIRRIVHVSVVGARRDAPTAYVRAKAVLEGVVAGCGIEWSIVRPTLTYGPGDILINNLAWALRRLPVYGMPGRGDYPIQPVHVDDVARICIEAAGEPSGTTMDAAGPITMAYRDLVQTVRSAVGSRALVVPMPAAAVLIAGRLLGLVVGDVVLTRDEIRELTSGWLVSEGPPRGRIEIAAWAAANASHLGRRWSSELARNYPSGGHGYPA